MFFWNSLVLSMNQCMLTVRSLVPLPFLNPACTSGSFQFTYFWSLAWRILNISHAIMWNKCNCAEFEYYLELPFFGSGRKTDLFMFCGHCWVFQISWWIYCSTFTASSFRIWNSSAEISSPLLALFVVMLAKAHLTSHSRMSGSRWLITSSWLS